MLAVASFFRLPWLAEKVFSGTQGESGKAGKQGDPYCLPTIAAAIARANVGGETTVQMGVDLDGSNPDPEHSVSQLLEPDVFRRKRGRKK